MFMYLDFKQMYFIIFFTKIICVLNESVFIYIKGAKECCKDSVVLHFTFMDRVYHLVCKCIKQYSHKNTQLSG